MQTKQRRLMTELVWTNSKDDLPKTGQRVLVFSPQYKEHSMRFRIMDGEFLRFCTDSTCWAQLNDPENIE